MIGIVTFHGSHNYGSMLQAYATQQALLKLGYASEIINFRMKSQKEYYALYQTKYGAMRFFRGLLLLPLHKARKQCAGKFEAFLNEYYKLSGNEISDYDGLKSVSEKYDIYLSGSDQIWSDMIPEFVGSSIDYTGVYFLDFIKSNRRKVAYATSIGEISYDRLKLKSELLKKYDYITTRENSGAEILEKILNRRVETVLDPTLLLNKDEWKAVETHGRIIEEKYIFLYTLRGIRPGIKWGNHLTKFAKRFNLKVVCVSPFFPVMHPEVLNLVNVGPKEFLNLIDNAEIVFTDSFHGTAFAINFQKPFYSLTKSNSKDMRKIGIIKCVGLEDRILKSFDDIDNIQDFHSDYTEANTKLNAERNNSIDILRRELSLE